MKQSDLQEYLKNPDREIVTRAGCKVRILCTDRNHPTRPIIALAQIDGGENIYSYRKDGSWLNYTPSPSDLFFAPERKTGWMNVCKYGDDKQFSLVGGVIHPTREQALTERPDYVVDTIQIKWEEK